MSDSATIEKQHITRTPGVCGGRPCIAGTRITVENIVLCFEAGDSADDIVESFPHLTLADVYAAMAYYFDNREEIDRQISEGRAFVEEMKRHTGIGPLERKLQGKSANAEVPS